MTYNFATFNVRGLTKDHKRHLLIEDCYNYKLDILCVQETKCTKLEDIMLSKNYRLMIMEQRHGRHGGLGFVIAPRMLQFVKTYKYISDRVAILDIEIPNSTSGSIKYRIVNAYGPTNPRCIANPQLVTDFYNAVTSAIDIPSRYELFVMGDFNSRLGKLSDEERTLNVTNHIGIHAVGIRNCNGEHLLDFIVLNNLFACNTAFQHKSRHITTRTGWISDGNNKTRPVFSQIDYILCRTRSKKILQDCRSYAGGRLDSDHKIVITKIDLGKPHILHRQKPKRTSYNVSRLTSNRDVQSQYMTSLNSKISSIEYRDDNDPASKLKSLMCVIKSTAADVVGLEKPNRNANHSNDKIVVDLVEHRRQLRLQLNNNESADRSVLRAQINRSQKMIKKRLTELKCEEADHLVSTISSTDESRRMFEAVRVLTNSKPSRPLCVHNIDGCVIAADDEKAEVIKSWFEKHFTGEETPISPFDSTIPRPLDTPITAHEVEVAVKKLKNNRACGPDEVPNELLKYAGLSFCNEFSKIINQCFETNKYIDTIGESILTPLQKPGKPVGPLKNLRPLNLLNGIRKILSVLTLNRIQEQVDQYTGPWQCGYKPGHGCADIVWSQQMLISVVLRKHCEFFKMGIDMTSAFDTVKRSTILRLLEDAGCSQDDVRLVRLLLANTTVRVRVNGVKSTVFISTKGAFQGDSLSGNLFTLTLAGSLNHLRVVFTARPQLPIARNGMPIEWEYADDADFADDNIETLEEMLPVCTRIFKEWDLGVNENKTEFVHLHLARPDDVDNDGNSLVDNEAWRASKSLGSLLCSTRDIKHRIQLANAAFQTYSKVWLRGTKIPLKRKLLVYEAQVVSVLLYNCGCWSAPKHIMSKLDTCQRRHLRRILNVSWPTGVISNRELYRRCQAVPITERVRKSRWTLLGHILRMDDNCPPVLALRFAVTSDNLYKGRRGRPRINLLNTIQADLREHGIMLKSVNDFDILRLLALDKARWRNMFRD